MMEHDYLFVLDTIDKRFTIRCHTNQMNNKQEDQAISYKHWN